jgi:hypothetical protein
VVSIKGTSTAEISTDTVLASVTHSPLVGYSKFGSGDNTTTGTGTGGLMIVNVNSGSIKPDATIPKGRYVAMHFCYVYSV